MRAPAKQCSGSYCQIYLGSTGRSTSLRWILETQTTAAPLRSVIMVSIVCRDSFVVVASVGIGARDAAEQIPLR